MVKHSEFIEKLKEIYGSERIITVNTTCRGYGFNTRIPLDQVSASLCFVTNFDDDGNVFIQDNDIFEDLYEWYGDEFEEKYNEVLSRLKLLAEKYNVEFDEKTNTFKIKILSIEQDTVKDYVSRFTNFLVSAVNVFEYLKEERELFKNVEEIEKKEIQPIDMIPMGELYGALLFAFPKNKIIYDTANSQILFYSEYYDEFKEDFCVIIKEEYSRYTITDNERLFKTFSKQNLKFLKNNDLSYMAFSVVKTKVYRGALYEYDDLSLTNEIFNYIKYVILLNNLDCFSE